MKWNLLRWSSKLSSQEVKSLCWRDNCSNFSDVWCTEQLQQSFQNQFYSNLSDNSFSHCWLCILFSLWPRCSVQVFDVELLLSILVCAAANLFCACLVNVQVSALYVIAGSVWRMPSSLPWFFVVSLCPGSFPWDCSVAPGMCVAFNIFYQHIVHVDWDVVNNHHINCVLAMFIFLPIYLLSSDSSCSIRCIVILVVFLCIRIYHLQTGVRWEILHLSSHPYIVKLLKLVCAFGIMGFPNSWRQHTEMHLFGRVYPFGS